MSPTMLICSQLQRVNQDVSQFIPKLVDNVVLKLCPVPIRDAFLGFATDGHDAKVVYERLELFLLRKLPYIPQLGIDRYHHAQPIH